jgi:hypothetical protein
MHMACKFIHDPTIQSSTFIRVSNEWINGFQNSLSEENFIAPPKWPHEQTVEIHSQLHRTWDDQ